MFDDPYIEALQVDPDLADKVYELWDAGVIADNLPAWCWVILVASNAEPVDLLTALKGMAKNVRKLSEHRVWCYKGYFSDEN